MLATAGSAFDNGPVSVDVQALSGVPDYALMPQSTAIARVDLPLYEAVARLGYRAGGRSESDLVVVKIPFDETANAFLYRRIRLVIDVSDQV